MKLFICHASEDKDGFVRPLAEALRATYEVWYDEWSLTIGDSLLKKINAGLAECDFAVVVLSPYFFQKKWPQNELDGLLSLEETTRKIILPVWKDVSREDVNRYSPILAGRLAAQASDGLQKVVSEIQRAIDVSARTREISAGASVIQKALQVSQTIAEIDNANRLLHCEEGVALVMAAMERLAARFNAVRIELERKAQPQPLQIQVLPRPMSDISPSDFSVKTNCGQEVFFGFYGVAANCSKGAELHVMLEQVNLQRRRESTRIWDFVFTPTFRLPKEVVWRETVTKQLFATDALADHLFEKLLGQIQRTIA
jgi:hypothetical protein